MAISRIRGEQIKQEVLRNQHIAADAAIEETKLSIDWASHYQQSLITKKVVDFVQVNGTDVGGFDSLDLTPIIPNSVPNVLSDPLSGEGVIVDAPKNRVPLRDAVTGDPVVDDAENEVYGRVVFDTDKFVIKFFSLVDSTETAFTMPAGQKIDWQYAKRFNLDTVNEMFAANEKFVEAAADATAHLNINQLAKDLYGAGFSLDRDGNANLAKSLVQQLSEEVTARTAAVQAVRDDLASNAAGKGASLIGVQDAGNHFTATTAEGVLAEIGAALENLSNGGSTTQTEVDAARESSLTGAHDSLEARLEADLAEIQDLIDAETTRAEAAESKLTTDLAAEVTRATAAEDQLTSDLADEVDRATAAEAQLTSDLAAEVTRATAAEAANAQAISDEAARATAAESALSDRATALETEVQTARGTTASLDARLDRALNENGTLKAGQDIHKHYKAYYQATGGETSVLLSAFNIANLPAYQVGDSSLDVFVNGILQNEGLHYAESTNGLSIDFSMGDGTSLVAGDLVTVKFHINNAE